MSCSACAKTLLSFCVYEQRLCCVFAVYVFATHVNRPENWKTDRFTTSHRCVCAQKRSRAFAVTVWMLYISCSACAKTSLSFCVYEQRLCRVFAVYVIAMHVNRPDNAKNRSIYCITSTCRCAKAGSCLRSICVYVVYKLNVWVKRCYCSVCDCAACKSIDLRMSSRWSFTYVEIMSFFLSFIWLIVKIVIKITSSFSDTVLNIVLSWKNSFNVQMHTFKIYEFKHKHLASASSKFTHCNAWNIFLCTSDAALIHHFFMKLDIAALRHLFIMKSTCTFNAHYFVQYLRSISTSFANSHDWKLKRISNNI